MKKVKIKEYWKIIRYSKRLKYLILNYSSLVIKYKNYYLYLNIINIRWIEFYSITLFYQFIFINLIKKHFIIINAIIKFL